MRNWFVAERLAHEKRWDLHRQADRHRERVGGRTAPARGPAFPLRLLVARLLRTLAIRLDPATRVPA